MKTNERNEYLHIRPGDVIDVIHVGCGGAIAVEWTKLLESLGGYAIRAGLDIMRDMPNPPPFRCLKCGLVGRARGAR